MKMQAGVDPVVGLGTALLTLVSGFLSLHMIVLMILTPLASVLDLLLGARKASVRKRLGLSGGYDRAIRDEGLINKGVLFLSIFLIGFSIDMILKVGSESSGLEIANWFSSYSPVLSLMLAWFWAREITSALDNIATTPGSEGAIWPGVMNIIQGIRYRITGKNPPLIYQIQKIESAIQSFPEETQTKIRAIVQDDIHAKVVNMNGEKPNAK
ncbi:MAG: phage holin family protein [Bacilli bacterium]